MMDERHIFILVGCDDTNVEPKGGSIFDHVLSNQIIDSVSQRTINVVKGDTTANKPFHTPYETDKELFQIDEVAPIDIGVEFAG